LPFWVSVSVPKSLFQVLPQFGVATAPVVGFVLALVVVVAGGFAFVGVVFGVVVVVVGSVFVVVVVVVGGVVGFVFVVVVGVVGFVFVVVVGVVGFVFVVVVGVVGFVFVVVVVVVGVVGVLVVVVVVGWFAAVPVFCPHGGGGGTGAVPTVKDQLIDVPLFVTEAQYVPFVSGCLGKMTTALALPRMLCPVETQA